MKNPTKLLRQRYKEPWREKIVKKIEKMKHSFDKGAKSTIYIYMRFDALTSTTSGGY